MLVAVVGAVAWGVIALVRGEHISAAWLIVAAVGSYAIGYRFYARFITRRVLGTDNRRATPAERLQDDADFQPTDRRVLFGHHFAAIAGAGPARRARCWRRSWATCRARSGSSSGVIFGGAVQDMVTSCSSRCGATASRSARWRARRSARSAAPRR